MPLDDNVVQTLTFLESLMKMRRGRMTIGGATSLTAGMRPVDLAMTLAIGEDMCKSMMKISASSEVDEVMKQIEIALGPERIGDVTMLLEALVGSGKVATMEMKVSPRLT
jgi:hypothetical protein